MKFIYKDKVYSLHPATLDCTCEVDNHCVRCSFWDEGRCIQCPTHEGTGDLICESFLPPIVFKEEPNEV